MTKKKVKSTASYAGAYLIPDEDTAAGNSTYFKFDGGLRKATQPWADEADRYRGITHATALLLEEGADKRRC